MLNQQALESLGKQSISHLQKESEILQKFIDVCNTIRESLGNHDDSQINELNRQQQAIQSEAESIGDSRMELRQSIAIAIGRQVEASSIKSLEDNLKGPIAQEIGEIREKIEGQVGEIQALSQTNAMLLQNNIDIFRRLILAVNGQDQQSQTYSSSGQLQNPKVKVPIRVSSTP
jgi:hypothetical protein